MTMHKVLQSIFSFENAGKGAYSVRLAGDAAAAAARMRSNERTRACQCEVWERGFGNQREKGFGNQREKGFGGDCAHVSKLRRQIVQQHLDHISAAAECSGKACAHSEI
jgi:hypothetical protein